MKRYRAYSTQIISELPAEAKESILSAMLEHDMMPTRSDISISFAGNDDPRYIRIVNVVLFQPPRYPYEDAKGYKFCWLVPQGKDADLEGIARDLRDFILNREREVWMLNQRGRITIDKRILEE